MHWNGGTMAAFLIAAACGWGAPSRAAAADTYQVDAVHSAVMFKIKHLNVSNFYGRFNEVSGQCVIDEKDAAKCAFNVEVKVASIDTSNKARDQHLKAAEFFNVDKYAVIAFKSKTVKNAGEHVYEVAGEMTLCGVTKPLTVKVEMVGAGPGMRGETRAGFDAHFKIKRSDFGMDAMLDKLGDEIEIWAGLEGVRK